MFRTGRKRLWIGAGLAIALAACLAFDSRLVTGEDAYATVGRSIDEYAETLKILARDYYKPLDSEEFIPIYEKSVFIFCSFRNGDSIWDFEF